MRVEIGELKLEDLTEEVYESLPEEVRSAGFDVMKDHLAKRIAGGGVTVVCKANKEYAGSASIVIDYKLDGRKVAFYEDLYVAAKYRKKGIGGLITAYVASTAWELGCDQVIGATRKGSYAGMIHVNYGAEPAPDGILWYAANPGNLIPREEWLKKINLDDFKPVIIPITRKDENRLFL